MALNTTSTTHISFLLYCRPLVDVDDNIVGIVSWGATSCDPFTAPAVFARVSAKWDWINQRSATMQLLSRLGLNAVEVVNRLVAMI